MKSINRRIGMKKIAMLMIPLILLMSIFAVVPVSASDGNCDTLWCYISNLFSSMTGKAVVGIQDTGISSCADLQNMNNNLAGDYYLTQNIDCTGFGGAAGFVPIGDDANRFAGTFDGRGYNITGLYINKPSMSGGLFSWTSTPAVTIANVGLININVVGGSYTGALVGNNRATITNCFSTGSVSGSNYVGGLVGVHYGIITNSFSSANVNGGMLVGGLTGTIEPGGFASTVSNSYATGNVSGGQYIGGLSSFVQGTVSNCYATGSVSGSDVGGLAGYFYSGTISNSYSVGQVTGSGGGLIGLNNAGTVLDSFWDTQTSGKASSAGGTGKTTAEMKTQSTYAGWDTNIWTFSGGYPLMQWQAPQQLVVETCGVNSTAGMVSYWKGEGNAQDSKGSNQGTFGGDANANAVGKVGNAFNFDGNGDYVEVPYSQSVDLTNSLTLEGWVYFTGDAQPYNSNFLISKQNPINLQYSLGRYNNNPPRNGGNLFISGVHVGSWYDCGACPGCPGVTLPGEYYLQNNQWYHIASTFDGSQVKLYANGQLIQSCNKPGTIIGGAGKLFIGGDANYPTWTEWTQGIIDEVAVYNRALSESEINQHYINGNAGQPYCEVAAQTTCAKYAENDAPVQLTCPSGIITGIISAQLVANADNSVTCPNGGTPSTQCYAPCTYSTVSNCVGQSSCTFSNIVDCLGPGWDPCQGVWKKMVVVAQCSGAPVCGNNIKETGEVCDGTDLNSQTCQDIVPGTTGTLSCNAQCSGFNTSQCQAPVPGECPSGMVSYWKFDEGSGTTASDSKDSNHGTLSGGTWIPGKVGSNALSFSGDNQEVIVPHNDNLNFGTNDFSVEFWYRTTDTSDNVVISKENSWFVMFNAGAISFYDSDTAISFFIPNAVYANGQWNHLAFVKTASTFKLYLNAQEYAIGAGDPIYQDYNLGGTLRIGGYWSGNTYDYVGDIDEVAIYHQALSVSDIQAHAAGNTYCEAAQPVVETCGVNSTQGIVSYWKADGTANDAFGTNNGNWVGTASYITGRNGVGQAFNLQGGGQGVNYISVPHNSNLNFNQITVETWIKPSDIIESSDVITKAQWPEMSMPFDLRTGYYEGFVYAFLNDGLKAATSGKSVLTQGAWNYVAMTYGGSGSQLKLYVNGEVFSTPALTLNLEQNIHPLTIGKNYGPNELDFRGGIDEVAVYNRALSDSEISQHYINGNAGQPYCEATAPTQVCGNNILESPEVCDGTDLNSQTCSDIIPGTTGTLSCNAQCSDFITTQCIPVDTDGDGIPDSTDNCVDEINPDQLNKDNQNGGDVCDVCPEDAADSCNQLKTGGEYIPQSGGDVTNQDNSLTVTVPASATSGSSFAMQEAMGTDLTVKTGAVQLAAFNVEPSGAVFNQPVTLSAVVLTTALTQKQINSITFYMRRDDGTWTSYPTTRTEILGDGIGDNDGICEPNERCTATTSVTHFSVYALGYLEELPECTLEQMLDIDGNGIVDINDAIHIMRYLTGQAENTGETRSCEAFSLAAQ